MSYTIDANVLLYASDRASPFHEAASAFLEARSRDPDVLLATREDLAALEARLTWRLIGAMAAIGAILR